MTTPEVVVQGTTSYPGFAQNVFEVEVDGAATLQFFHTIFNEGVHGGRAIDVFPLLYIWLCHEFIVPQADLNASRGIERPFYLLAWVSVLSVSSSRSNSHRMLV